MKQVTKKFFEELQKLGLIKTDKHECNYGKSKRYRYVEESVLEKYNKNKS